MDNGLILSAAYQGKACKAWIYRPQDADVFVDEARKLVDVTYVEPFSSTAIHDVTCAVGWRYSVDLLERFNRIQWVQSTSSGLDHLESFRRRHPAVVLTAMRGLNADIVAEYALAQVLALRWRVLTYYRQMQQKIWYGYKTSDVSSTQALIIGMGEIGQRIAGFLTGLGMSVMAVRRRPEPCANVNQVFGFDQLHEALILADYLILSLPLTEETRHIIGADELSAMKQDSYLINLSRGGIVDENALAHALHNQQIGGAVLDVTEEEPYPVDSPLWDAPNLLITPHVAGEHADFARRAARCWAKNLQLFLANDVYAFNSN